ncbi:hypothetical protein A4R44_05697 [Amycolatopsis sp. M39]|nr:hypothetical protein A4R44_05697 [Amycolatopsis sp. M39]
MTKPNVDVLLMPIVSAAATAAIAMPGSRRPGRRTR